MYCNGEEVLTTSGTKAKYTVDIWSGNHPFFKGSSNVTLVDEGSVNRFKRRYAGLDSLSDMTRIKTGAVNSDVTASFSRGIAHYPIIRLTAGSGKTSPAESSLCLTASSLMLAIWQTTPKC